MKDPEMIIEKECVEASSASADAEQGGTLTTAGLARPTETSAPAEDTAGAAKPKAKGPSPLQQIKEQASEDDKAPTGTLTLRQIVGGDYLLTLARHYVWLIMLVVVLTCVYVGVRYQCQQDVIKISNLERELVDAKFRAMSSSSNLTELCRQSNVLKVLSENEDNKLIMPEQPPYIIPVDE
jgi:hypothetical protein